MQRDVAVKKKKVFRITKNGIVNSLKSGHSPRQTEINQISWPIRESSNILEDQK